MVKARILCIPASYQQTQEHSRLYEISAVGQEQKKKEKTDVTNGPTDQPTNTASNTVVCTIFIVQSHQTNKDQSLG